MRKSKLVKYAWDSKIMEVAITYGEEKFHFNLNSEIIIDENRINEEIKEQPSVYGFLGMLLIKLERIMNDKKREMEKVYSHMYIKFKTEMDESTGRVTSHDLAKEKANNSNKYQNKVDEYHDAKQSYGSIKNCVQSFEQRHLLIQTLSANIRKG